MEDTLHTLTSLFTQLGLPSRPEDIQAFLASHGPLAPGLALPEAPFWSASQATFLREELEEDADWAGVIDRLDASLRGSAS